MARMRTRGMRFAGGLAVLALAWSCKPAATDGGDTKVVGGKEVGNDHYPAVVRLTFPSRDGRSYGLCTGTFVSETTVITASHCVEGHDTVRLDDGRSSGTLLMNSTYAAEKKRNGATGAQASQHLRHDVALLIFPRRAGQATMPLSARRPAPGTRVEFVGYGRNQMGGVLETDPDARKAAESDEGGAGTRRWGTNVLLDVTGSGLPEMLGFTGPATSTGPTDQNSLGSGDSGGPLIVDGQVVGIASFVAPAGPKSDNKIHSFYSSVNYEPNVTFLNEAVRSKGAEIKGLTGQGAGPADADSPWYIPPVSRPGNTI